MPVTNVRQIKVMISSTRADLDQYREEASKIIKRVEAEREKRVHFVEVSMERKTQSGDREFAVAVSKGWVEESDWVVVIVGWNYGWISDEAGADGLSVTEWEYRHAAADPNKKLFVFVAGEPGTTNQYRVSPEEKEDLKDWITKQTQEQAQKHQEFRHELRKRYVDMFANLNMFRERLEKTLKDAVDALPPEIQPGTPIAELIVPMTREIKVCIRKVKVIANCKQIHDCLHEILQNVIRPLREEVLPVWEQEETLSESRIWVIMGCVTRAAEQRGTIKGVGKPIEPEHWALRDSVDNVVNEIQRWVDCTKNMPTTRPWPSGGCFDEDINDLRGRFAEDVDDLASLVEHAFSEADQSMTTEESELRDRYSTLLEDLQKAREQSNLSADDHRRLDEELEKIKFNRQRVKLALSVHHSWQEIHNKLNDMEIYRGTEPFKSQLNRYCRTELPKLFALVDCELDQAQAFQAGSTELNQETVAPADQQTALPSSSCLPEACGVFVNDLRCLKNSLEGLRHGDGAVAFDNIRKPFEDAFFYVDKRTLEEVSRAEERVIALDTWLDGLAPRRRKAD
jgi:hypothetical protein